MAGVRQRGDLLIEPHCGLTQCAVFEFLAGVDLPPIFRCLNKEFHCLRIVLLEEKDCAEIHCRGSIRFGRSVCFRQNVNMFFFFRDGHKILERIFYYTPLSDEDETRMLTQFASITRATVKGTLVIGVIQGALAGVAFWVAGLEGAALWGTIMTILSIIPGIGAALVWVPAVIILFVTGQHLTATLLAVWCAAVVGTVDNFLRPVLVGRDAKMPDLLIMIGTLGGLFLFGLIGFIVGPIVCGLFLTVWDIYGTTFREILPPVTSFRRSDQDASTIAPQKSSDQ